MKLEELLHSAMLDMYVRAGQETGYWGRRFLQSVKKTGGLATAKRMLKPRKQKAQLQGLSALVNARRADLSLESLVLRKPFSRLFNNDELREARRRLAALPLSAMPFKIAPESNFPESSSLFKEGGILRINVNAYERDPNARKLCLKKWGTNCQVCQLNFEEKYGKIGKGFIHVHHIDPLGRRKRRRNTDPVTDLIPVCPNCHAMLHTSDPPLGIEELRNIIRINFKS